MKHRIKLIVVISLIIILSGLIWSLFLPKFPERIETFQATASRDCAPWDGAAFKISIRYHPASIIEISVWRSPSIKFPAVINFDGSSGTTGSAIYHQEFGDPVPLIGTVIFQSVQEDTPITGIFNLRTGSGPALQGRFRALWISQPIICG